MQVLPGPDPLPNAVLETRLADLEARLRHAEAERLAALSRLNGMTLQRDVARAAVQRGGLDSAHRLHLLDERARQAEADAAHWRDRYERLRGRMWRILRLSGFPLAVRLVPRPVRRFIRVRLLG